MRRTKDLQMEQRMKDIEDEEARYYLKKFNINTKIRKDER